MPSKFQILIHDNITLSSQLKETEIDLLKNVHKTDMGNGYIWYRFDPCEISGEKIVFSVCFYKGKCETVNLCIYNPQKYGGGWDDWSEEKEKLCVEDTGKWLAKIGFPVGNYPWGTIWAAYDPKGGSGHAGVRFN